jgi:hypothetical protein
VKATGTRPKIVVGGDGRGVVGHAGARLLADVADATGLTSGFSDALAALRQRRAGHDPGRIAVDLAVMLADGGQAIADLAVLRDQAALFGAVASDPTAWRVLSGMDAVALARLRQARAVARELAWAQTVETRGRLAASTAAGMPVPGIVLDVDASIVICHSEKEAATRTWKKTFGYHPLFCFLDGSREALSGLLREGRAGSNTTADHITVLDRALEQIPDAHRYGTEILVRSDSAGCTHGFLAHIRSLREHASTPGSPSASRSPNPSARRSAPPPAGSRRWTPTETYATEPRSARSPTCCPPTGAPATPKRRGSSSDANARTPASN